ncbi:hypothetical protein [Brachybacterium sp.]|uniref:hypothetical protein n=1 Tax=Brachybacterium sp. TaxID=1891286 RepID=UPI002ED65722
MRSARRPRGLMITVVGMAALAACGNAGGEYCATLTDHSEVSAMVFTPVIPGMNDQEGLDLLAEVEDSVPEEISEDVTTWQAYLKEVEPLIGS